MFNLNHRKNRWLNKLTSAFIAFTFALTLSLPPQSFAQVQNSLNLPAPGTMVTLSPAFNPTILKGVQIHPDNPLKFEFIVDRGDSKLENDALKAESQKLIKYFLAAMTIPEEDLWVNLNPYEQDKITNNNLGVTEMGRDLLAQDYLLKQLSASLIYPEKDLGKNFWDRVYKKTYELFGRTDVPVNTFNKVWIIPDKAVVYEEGNTAFVMESHMKVMLEEDYLALDNNLKDKRLSSEKLKDTQVKQINNISSAIVREVILPEIEKEVNEGKNFASLRQIYNSLVLAAWFKNSLKNSLLGKIYVDKSKVAGVDVDDRAIKDKIYDQYMLAYKKGVYDYIRQDYDPAVKKVVPRNYFSGGFTAATMPRVEQTVQANKISPVERGNIQTKYINPLRENSNTYVASVSLQGTQYQERGEGSFNQPIEMVKNIEGKYEPIATRSSKITTPIANAMMKPLSEKQLAEVTSIQVSPVEIPRSVLTDGGRTLIVNNQMDLASLGKIKEVDINNDRAMIAREFSQRIAEEITNNEPVRMVEVTGRTAPIATRSPEITTPIANELMKPLNREQQSRVTSIEVRPVERPVLTDNDQTLIVSHGMVQNPANIPTQQVSTVSRPEVMRQILSKSTELTSNPSGIDLNTKKLLNLQTSGKGITPFDFKNVNIDLDQLQKNGFDGFVPVIENLVPIQNFQLLFGQNKASTSDSLPSPKLSSNK